MADKALVYSRPSRLHLQAKKTIDKKFEAAVHENREKETYAHLNQYEYMQGLRMQKVPSECKQELVGRSRKVITKALNSGMTSQAPDTVSQFYEYGHISSKPKSRITQVRAQYFSHRRVL